MIKTTIMFFIVFISFIYAKFFLARFCKEEIQNFEKFLKKFKIKFLSKIILIIFTIFSLILILAIENPLFSLFLIPLFFSIFVKNKKISDLLILLFFLTIFVFNNPEIFTLFFTLFSLIYFSLN